MNPETIYTNFRDAALAEMFTAERYSTFVAMPFQDRFSYHPKEILGNVIQESAKAANRQRGGELKEFALPETVGMLPGIANVITEDIVKKILFSHFFIADLTEGNHGVLIETGIAMAFKPTSQIILITQGSVEDLHFDIQDNRVVPYNPTGNIESIAPAFLAAANSFEEDRKRYVTQVSKYMSVEAIRTLHFYAALYQNPELAAHNPGIFYKPNMPPFFNEDYGDNALTMFTLTLKELQNKRMIWTDFSVGLNAEGKETAYWATHATRLGWLVVKHFWPDYRTDLCTTIR